MRIPYIDTSNNVFEYLWIVHYSFEWLDMEQYRYRTDTYGHPSPRGFYYHFIHIGMNI